MNSKAMHRLLFVFLMVFNSMFSQETTIYFQNNSSSVYYVSAVQFGTQVMDTSYWKVLNDTIPPWESDFPIFETNREVGVNNGEDYFFDVFVVNQNNDTVTLQLHVQGQSSGSSMDFSAKGTGFDHPWYNNNTYYSEFFSYGGSPATIVYKPKNSDNSDSRDLLYVLQDENPKYDIAAADVNNKNVLNVLTFNIKLLPGIVGPGDNNTRSDYIPSFIHPNQDVVVFEEAFDEGAVEDHLTPAMEAQGFLYHTPILNKNGNPFQQNGGVIIFSKWLILDIAEYDFRDCDNNSGDCMADKGILYAEILKLGKTYHVFGTHMEAGKQAGDIAVITEQFGEFRDFIDSQYISNKEPVIMAGDMNIAPIHGHWHVVKDSLDPIIGKHMGLYSSKGLSYDTLHIVDHVWGGRKHQVPKDYHTTIWMCRSAIDVFWGHNFEPSDHLPSNGRFEYHDVDTNVTIDTIKLCSPNDFIQLSVPSYQGMSYQWYQDSVKIVGATNSTLTLNGLGNLDTGLFFVDIYHDFVVNDPSAMGHPDWPDTARGSFLFRKGFVYMVDTALPKIRLSGDTIFSDKGSVSWYDQNGVLLDSGFYVVVDTSQDNYYYISFDNSCDTLISDTIYTEESQKVGIEKSEILAAEFFPNPFDNELVVKHDYKDATITLYDSQGKMIYQKAKASGMMIIPTKMLKKGVYQIVLSSKEMILSKKVVRR